MPVCKGPEENRDGVLDPAVQRCEGGRRRRQVGGRSVDEDADQNIRHNKKAGLAEKDSDEVHYGSPRPCRHRTGTHERPLLMRPSVSRRIRNLCCGMTSIASPCPPARPSARRTQPPAGSPPPYGMSR